MLSLKNQCTSATYRSSHIWLGVIFLLIITVGCNQSDTKKSSLSDEKTSIVRVATFNIHHANPPGQPGVIDVKAVAAAIKKMNADLVALQEVDVHTHRSGTELHQAKKLAQLTGMNFFFSKSMDYDGGAYGNAVLSRYPIADSSVYHLPVDPKIGGEPRSVVAITIQLPDSSTIIFASTHLGYKSKENRLLQVEKIKEAFANETTPIILAGDFNMMPGSAAFDSLETLFYRPCGDGCAPTIPVDQPEKAIDFILTHPKTAFNNVSRQVQTDITVSDHLPVVAAFKF